MRTTIKSIVLAMALAAASGGVQAQDFAFGWNPRTGDMWIDQRLGDINDYGYRHRDPFIDEMVVHYGAPRVLVRELLVDRHWAPGDVYYACSIANILGIPCRNVVEVWDRDHGQGWGAIAKRMGIKPGSAEFHRLKKGFVPSYDRWGRTIVLDADLRRDYPDRGNGKTGSRGQGSGKSSTVHGNSGKSSASHGKSSKNDMAPAPGKSGKSSKSQGAGKDKGSGKDNQKGGKGNGKPR
ncbi:hypothetical protein IP90_02448 [Luteimonas cucumeris]|uniref:Uncharacterized protein n=1 Tax=Luteimonas cucumeris TaxID=985012 RepID=A0A562L2N8_9GAMM|nr:hypothetical protein [Luteimonas cucumeris]TWI01888.1 hypothetical protein IP90_02448 [Luteimonas cucumeris]